MKSPIWWGLSVLFAASCASSWDDVGLDDLGLDFERLPLPKFVETAFADLRADEPSIDAEELFELSSDGDDVELETTLASTVPRVGPDGPDAERADEQVDANENGERGDVWVLRAPGWRFSGPVQPYVRERGNASLIARPYWFNSPIYQRPDASRRVVGMARRNTELPVTRRISGAGCKGVWYELVGGGYVCRDDGFAVGSNLEPARPELQLRPPGHEQPLPYTYAKVRAGEPPIFTRLPTREELDEGSDAPVKEHSTGAHFVAIEQMIDHEGEGFIRTARGFYLRVEDIEFLPPSKMNGSMLDDETTLPLVFVHHERVSALDPETMEPVGLVEKYARSGWVAELEHDGKPLVEVEHGFLLPREDVRIAHPIPRPDRIPDDAQWVAVDLDEQVLVAFEGDRPILATLVASGKAGYEPALGVFRLEKKYLTKTMRGPDDETGTYAVEQVPWTIFYWGSLALHGAYWHDGFGTPRSHGCTNIPPVDARWLFHWANPELPVGWHSAVRLDGPYLYVTRSSAHLDDA